MSYQFLGLLQKESGKLKQERHQALEPMLRQGLELLVQAEQAGFTDLNLLSQAAECFLRAEQADRRDIRPCLFLAYIFMLLDDLHRASLFINEARRHDSKHPLVLRFGQKLSELHQLNPPPSQVSPAAQLHQQPFPEDPELMHEAIEKEIMAQLREIQQLPPPAAGAQAAAVGAFAEQLAAFRQHLERLQAGLRQLDQHNDVLELKMRLRPFEVMLHRHTSHLKGLQEEQQIAALIAVLRIDVSQALNRLRAGEAPDTAYEAQLDAFLDRLDALADRIDALEAQGQASPQLEESYSRAMHLLEDYRDALDDLPAN